MSRANTAGIANAAWSLRPGQTLKVAYRHGAYTRYRADFSVFSGYQYGWGR